MFGLSRKERGLFLILIGSFAFTELIDDFLDHTLGISVLHSAIQLFLFTILFIAVTLVFLNFHRKSVRELIPEKLMRVLRAIKEQEEKGVLLNQVRLTKILDITKPTIRKRLEELEDLGYIQFDMQGNNKYIKLTEVGMSLVK